MARPASGLASLPCPSLSALARGAICSARDGSSGCRPAPHRFASDVRARDADHRPPQCTRPFRGDRLGPRQRRVLVASRAVHEPRRELDRGRADRREQLHRLIAGLLGHGQEVLGRWANVMVNSGTYAEIVDRHVELYSRLYWWGSVLDESEPLEEHLGRPRLSRLSPATQAAGPVEAEWLRDNLVAIGQLAEALD